jgi:hypothetical protein
MSQRDDGDWVARSCDAVADEYARRIGDEHAHKPLDRAR